MLVDKIISYESGELDNDGVLELFSDLIKSGQVWHSNKLYLSSLSQRPACPRGQLVL
jgi:hypothetical protein